jgi:cysteinyl-tRNA synthetase, unknown class
MARCAFSGGNSTVNVLRRTFQACAAVFIVVAALPCALDGARAGVATPGGTKAGASSANIARPAAPAPRARATVAEMAAQKQRMQIINDVRSWVVQMQNLNVANAANAPADMILVDATSGVEGGRAMTASDVALLKQRPDGGRRVVISYLSIGEAEDYRPDYFNSEYMTEDAPDWLLQENKIWKGNRIIRFCEEGWQRTILGDDDGRNVYNSLDPSPLYKLIELGFDGVYLDRVDVYSEVQKECPDAAAKMIAFVERLAAHARKKNPHFIVISQNAEELLVHPRMVQAIDAVGKEDLFYGADHTDRANEPGMVKASLEYLAHATAAKRPIFVLGYIRNATTRATDKAKIEAQGFIPYFGPRQLDRLWIPGQDF